MGERPGAEGEPLGAYPPAGAAVRKAGTQPRLPASSDLYGPSSDVRGRGAGGSASEDSLVQTG